MQNGRLDLLAANQLGKAVYADISARNRGEGHPNLARFLFLDDYSRTVFPDWGAVADDAVATLHAGSARSPHARTLFELIGQLSTHSEAFRARWALRNVSAHRRGHKRIRHSQAGELSFQYESLEIPSSPGLQILTFLAEPGSTTEDALRLLGSLSASGVDTSISAPVGVGYWQLPEPNAGS